MEKTLHIVFDGPPGPDAGRFVEVEDGTGKSISAGNWSLRPDGLWELVIDPQRMTETTDNASGPVAESAAPIRYTNDGELAECPCCGSLDVGGAQDTVNCYGCGLQITKPRPLKNAADAWNMRTGRKHTAPPAAAVVIPAYRHLSEDLDAALVEGYNSALDEVARLNPAPVDSATVVPEGWWQIIHDTLRNYRMSTLDDGHGGGYPLIDAMTADGQSVAGGIEECTYLADAIWNGLLAAHTPEQPAKEQDHE